MITRLLKKLLHRSAKSRQVRLFVPCPHCGGEIRSDATFCRHCGSSEADGWSDEGYDDEEEFDYEQYVEDNHSLSEVSTSLSPVWRAVVAILVLAFVASLVVPLL